MRALVLSGGGFFGAWQVGAWTAFAEGAGDFQPDLIVGASVGALNGYAIACGATPEQLRGMWLRPQFGGFSQIPASIRELAQRFPRVAPRVDFALVITDLFRIKARIIRGPEVSAEHLAASCAVPFFLPQVRIDGRLYSDGGLLNPLPVWAAMELGATEILALNALPEIPLRVLKPFAAGFRAMFGINPPVPTRVSLKTVLPSRRLGSLRDALHWKRENIERWLAQGFHDAHRLQDAQ